jgi:hypothetical protein
MAMGRRIIAQVQAVPHLPSPQNPIKDQTVICLFGRTIIRNNLYLNSIKLNPESVQIDITWIHSWNSP